MVLFVPTFIFTTSFNVSTFVRPRGRGGIRGGFTGPRGGRRGYQGPRHFRAPRGKNMSLISFLIIAELSTVKGN